MISVERNSEVSILNLENYDELKEPLFLGKSLGIQSYDIMKYPQFMKMTVGAGGQWEKFWRPEEIELKKDRSDYENMSETERFIFTSNLKFQTMLDSVICRGVPAFEQYLSNKELEACMITWGFFELIHSYSYTYIIKNVYAEPDKIFKEILTDKEILERAKISVSCYNELYKVNGSSEKKIKEQIYLSLIAVNILEAIRFYVSFVCAFAFAEVGKMSGNADIIGLIRRDEACVTPDTEVLTTTGWIKFSKLRTGQKVAQYNKDRTIEFVEPKLIEKDYDGHLINIFNKIGHVDMMLTEDHRVVFEKLDGSISECQAENFNGNYLKKIPVCGKSSSLSEPLSDYERFLIALQADGTISNEEIWNGSISGCHRVSFRITKKRKQTRLISLLEKLGFSYTANKTKRENELHFYVKVPNKYELHKKFEDWFSYEKSSIWYQEFIEEVVQWDGHIRDDSSNTESYYYSSTIESNTDIVQTAACFSGYKTHKYLQEDNRKESYKDVYRLSILKNRQTVSGQSLKKKRIRYTGKVYCVSVPSGMFLARRNGGIFVTGNCHLGITQEILKILHREESEGFIQTAKDCRQQAIDMFMDAVEEEKKWASYLFKDGSILGLNEEILGQYIEYLTDTRLAALSFDKVFGTKDPMNWLGSWMNPSKVQRAPQEIDVTNYKIGSTENDLDNLDLF